MHEANPQDILFDEIRIQKLKEIKQDPFVVENFFSKEDIDHIMSVKESYEQVDKQGEVKNWRYSNQPDFYNWLHDKFTNVLDQKFEMHGGNFFKTNIPFFVHTDTAIDHDFVPYKNIVVPLTDSTPEHPCYTVTYDQRWYGEAVMFWKGPMFLRSKPDYNHKLVDYSMIENYTNKDFDVNDYINYMTHVPYTNLHGLSMHKVFEWKVGDIIVFDCNQLHSSNDFTKLHAPNPKYALSYFCKLKEQ